VGTLRGILRQAGVQLRNSCAVYKSMGSGLISLELLALYAIFRLSSFHNCVCLSSRSPSSALCSACGTWAGRACGWMRRLRPRRSASRCRRHHRRHPYDLDTLLCTRSLSMPSLPSATVNLCCACPLLWRRFCRFRCCLLWRSGCSAGALRSWQRRCWRRRRLPSTTLRKRACTRWCCSFFLLALYCLLRALALVTGICGGAWLYPGFRSGPIYPLFRLLCSWSDVPLCLLQLAITLAGRGPCRSLAWPAQPDLVACGNRSALPTLAAGFA